MEVTLELVFITSDDRNVRLSVNNPKEDLDGDTIKEAMEQIVALIFLKLQLAPFFVA